jgi:hypothetical protein
MDALHAILKWIDHNRYVVVGVLVALALSAWTIGCDLKTVSLINPEVRATAAQLEREISTIQRTLDGRAALIRQQAAALEADAQATNRDIAAAAADLQRQLDQRKAIIDAVAGIGTAVATGGFTAPAAIGAVAQLLLAGLATGAAIDSVRKSRVINKLNSTP